MDHIELTKARRCWIFLAPLSQRGGARDANGEQQVEAFISTCIPKSHAPLYSDWPGASIRPL